MDEVEKFFRCPYCREKISMLLDVSTDMTQDYFEDCEVCCRPVHLHFSVENGELFDFNAISANG